MKTARPSPSRCRTPSASARRFKGSLAVLQWLGTALTLALSTYVAPGDAAAQVVMEPPVYVEETKSYFTLVTVGNAAMPGLSWHNAYLRARTLTHNGVPGRLAIIPSRSVNDFLRDSFRPKRAVWIGLQYYCHLQKLVWVDGKELSRFEYQNWGPRWNIDGGSPNALHSSQCESGTAAYNPVHYWSVKSGFYWNANGKAKHFADMFVEFPTSKE
ncbi:MAG: C-type lectin domain-containing protein [Gammaproteobacteria bacterium]